MVFVEPLKFVTSFIDLIDDAIQEHGSVGLTRSHRVFLSFLLMGVMLTNTVCWTRFEQIGLGSYRVGALSWIFRRGRIAWQTLFQMSVKIVLREYGITSGVLVIDDSDRRRSKNTTKISGVHKMKDKTSGGFMMGQNMVFLLLVTEKVTIPVGVEFFQPDPVRSKWEKKDKELKKEGIPKKDRPAEPARNVKFPTKLEIGIQLLKQFKQWHGNITIKAILADALYGTAAFVKKASEPFPGVQVISQLRSNQKVKFRGKEISLGEYFRRYPGVLAQLRIRGGKDVTATVGSARLYVCSHGVKRFVVAVKYEGETEYRYLFASDLSWRTEDIVRTYTLRWLIEVFFQDWKGYEGWGQLTKLQGVDGSSNGMILSLLVDHCLLIHPAQLARLRHNKPAFTVGSLINNVKVESLVTTIRTVLDHDDPKQKLAELATRLAELYPLESSGKHMAGRDLGRQEPTPSLKYRVERAEAA